MKLQNVVLAASALLFCAGCKKYPEMTLEEIEAYKASASNTLVEKTVSKPFRDEGWVAGKSGGVWQDTISSDPKSFNLLIAERDGETTGILSPLVEYLVEYNTVKKRWTARCADYKIVNNKDGSMDLTYTLRDDLYWSFYKNSKPRVKVTSDDVIFWYNEIFGDREMESSAYNSQFVDLPDGSEGRITIQKVDDRSFTFHFPRPEADPLLATNMSFGPAFLYKAAKDKGGAKAVKDLFTVASDPKELPSMGPYFISEYTPGQRIIYERNDDYWEKDKNGQSIFYPQKKVMSIVSDVNTKLLLFKQGKLEDYGPLPEQLDDIVAGANNNGTDGYTVFNSAGGMSAPFWTFNQNPKNKDKNWYKWFTVKEFRQAMSCLLNRERIIKQTYRGLAEPKYGFFPEANAFYNEEILLEYRFSHAKADALLKSAGFARKDDGFLYDCDGNRVEFNLEITSSSPVYSDIAQIIADECKKAGITVNVRQTDFQKIVEELTATFDWQSLMIGLSGGAIFPTQGSNVWLSSGNLHMWYPLQETPATEWEARVDYLYKEGRSISDVEKARPYWEEYQRIILENCPVIYLVRSRSFYAINNRWDLSNVYFDNMVGNETTHVFLKN